MGTGREIAVSARVRRCREANKKRDFAVRSGWRLSLVYLLENECLFWKFESDVPQFEFFNLFGVF